MGVAWLRFLPHLLTGTRLLLGAAALLAAQDGRLYAAASLITIGAVTDGLDGLLARRLGVESAFGALFDYFADYVCFIIAPWMLVRGLLAGRGGMLQEALLLLPLVTGAVRYARNGMRLVALDADAGPLPGLGTVFFAFICVDAIFLDARTIVGAVWHDRLLTAFVVFFSVMMVVPVRYPKLTHFRGALPVVLVLLALMPFAGTRVLGVVMLVVGLLFAAFAPLAVHDRPHAPGDRLRRQPELRP